MWTIRQIFDGDYGCEERRPGEGPEVSVTLVDESGEERYVTVEDAWLTANGLDEGSTWPEQTEEPQEAEKSRDSDWTKNCTSKTVDIPSFVAKMRAVRAGQEVDWTCPFCGGRVVLMENAEGSTVIGCESCDMRIHLESN